MILAALRESLATTFGDHGLGSALASLQGALLYSATAAGFNHSAPACISSISDTRATVTSLLLSECPIVQTLCTFLRSVLR